MRVEAHVTQRLSQSREWDRKVRDVLRASRERMVALPLGLYVPQEQLEPDYSYKVNVQCPPTHSSFRGLDYGD